VDLQSLEKNLIYKFKDFVGIKRIAHE